MKTTTLFAFLFVCLCIGTCWAQTGVDKDWGKMEEEVEEILGEMDDLTSIELDEEVFRQELEDGKESEWMEDLYDLYNNPLNLNNVRQEDLQRLPFLTPIQVMDIMEYLSKHAPLLSLGELMLVHSIDYRTRQLLYMFTCVEHANNGNTWKWKNVWTYGRNELRVRTDIPFYRRAGFKEQDQSTQNTYIGSPYYHSIRYKFQASNQLEAGIQLEKDPGERGIDYLSAYALIHNRQWLETLAVGDFRTSFGLGLVVNTSTNFGKMMQLGTTSQLDCGIRSHTAMTESGFMRGVGATIRLNDQWRISAYASNHPIDGTLTTDRRGITTLKTDGLHRTQLERDKQGTLNKTDVGGNLNWRNGRLHLSATIAATHLSLPLIPKHNTPASDYRRYNPSGNNFCNYGLAYAFNADGVYFTGETAADANGHIALLHSLNTELLNSHFTLIHRYYSPRYISINGRAFGENREVRNESGLYLGWKYNLNRRTVLQAYADGMYFPWKKYKVDRNSYGFDGMVQLSHQLHNNSTWNVRYQMKWKQYLNIRQTLRARLQVPVGQHFSLRSTISGTLAKNLGRKQTRGFAVGQDIVWKKMMKGSITYFHTGDFASRIYAYEPSIPSTFGMNSYFYHGLRYVLLLSPPVGRHVTLNVRFSSLHYFDRETIGSGRDLIWSRHREDIQMQMRWSF